MKEKSLVLLGQLKEFVNIGVQEAIRPYYMGLINEIVELETDSQPLNIPAEEVLKMALNSVYGLNKEVGGKYIPRTPEIVFQTRREAEEVLSDLEKVISKYGQASVADLCDLSGVITDFRSNKFGWTSVKEGSVWRKKDGYIILLPVPELLS